MKEFIRFLKNTKWEFIATLIGGGMFFIALPVLLLHMYGSNQAGEANVGMIAPQYVVDFFWRLLRAVGVFLLGYGIFRLWFPTFERHADPDDNPLRSETGEPITFKRDWIAMTPTGRNSLTVAAILGILLSLTLLIVFP